MEVSVKRSISSITHNIEEWVERTLAAKLPGGPYERVTWQTDYGTQHRMVSPGTRGFFGRRRGDTPLLSVWVINGPGVGSKVIVTLYRPELEQTLVGLLPSIGTALQKEYGIHFELELEVSYL